MEPFVVTIRLADMEATKLLLMELTHIEERLRREDRLADAEAISHALRRFMLATGAQGEDDGG